MKKNRRERVRRRYHRREYWDSDDYDYDSEEDSDEYERWKRKKGMHRNKIPRHPSFDSDEYEDYRAQRAVRRQRRKINKEDRLRLERLRYYIEGEQRDSKGRRKYYYDEYSHP